MKTGTMKLFGLLTGLALLTVIAKADNQCVDSITYSQWSCDYPGSVSTLGTLTWNSTNICLNATLTPPQFASNPTFNPGSKTRTVYHTCYNNGTQTSNVVYSAGNLRFIPNDTNWPPVSGPFTNTGTYIYTALFDAIPDGGCVTNYGITNGTVTVNVGIPPSITLQPTNQTATVGNNVIFTAAADGTTPLAYQWCFNMTPLAGKTNTSLTLTNVQLAGAGSYTVVVTNAFGSATSSNAILTVVEPPYLALSGSLTNYTFKGDTTYYITGTVNLYGTNTFEGGAVIKYGVSASLNSTGVLNWQASSYRPVIFTAKDDDSVGGTIFGSTGSPTNYYASPALVIGGISPATLSNLRISYAQVALQIQNCSPAIADAQFVNCQSGITLNNATLSLRNALFSSVQTNFISTASGHVDAQNVTFAKSGYIGAGPASPDGSGLILTNCILANVTNIAAGNLSTNGYRNGFYNCQQFGANSFTNTANPFRTAGAGSYYLAANCTFTNAGTTNIDSTLLADLQKKTTYPPTVLSNVTVPVSSTMNPPAGEVVLSIQAIRDTNAPDLGYHYDPLDYIMDRYNVTNALLTVSSGVAIACYNENGIVLLDGSSINSIGSPLSPNWFVRYQSVQEQPFRLSIVPNNPPSAAFSIIPNHVATNGMTGMFRFSKFAAPASGGWHFYNTHPSNSFNNLFVQDCELWNGSNDLSGDNSTTVTLKNNLFARSDMSANSGVTNYSLSLSNNLFWNSLVALLPSSNTWSIFQNEFDTCVIATSTNGVAQATVNGDNAYINCNSQLSPTNGSDLVLTNAITYDTGALGAFYQPTNSLLISAGDTTAGDAGLYHYTVTTNQVIDGTNNAVSIGYHYMAVDAQGNLLSTGGSGVPDYIADANGNGIYDAGDVSDWTKFSTDGSGMSDSWEINNFGHIGVDPNADPDCDGRNNLQEYQEGTQPQNAISANGLLDRWSFSTTSWLSDLGYAPVSFTNLNISTLGDGNALLLDSANPARLRYNVVETNGATNLTVNQGTVIFWFAPNWSGVSQGGTGLGEWGRLIEVGACTTNASYGWWSLYVDPDGDNIYFSSQTNNSSGTTNTYLSAPIAWTTDRWHLIMLTYTATNSTLYLDGELAANGSGVTDWPGPDVLANGFYVGSDSNGVQQAHGMFDDLSTYNYPLVTNTVQNTYSSYQAAYYGNPLNPANTPSASSSVFNGLGSLQWLGSSGSCITSSNVWITNMVCTHTTNNTMTFTFTIAGGTSGVPYDVFAVSVLGSTNAWSWMGQGESCNTYALTNLSTTITFFILGTPQDSDSDGLTDAYEKLVSHTNPNNPDTDGDGLSDGWEVSLGLNPLVNDNAQPGTRSYYSYDLTDWLEGISGIRTGSVGLDAEGNVLSVSQ